MVRSMIAAWHVSLARTRADRVIELAAGQVVADSAT